MKSNAKNILIVLVFVALAAWAVSYVNRPVHPSQVNTALVPTNVDNGPLSIHTKDIHEDTFTGTRVIVDGSSVLADAANTYIDSTIADFKKQADIDVPGLQSQFGSDAPTAMYSIDFNGIYLQSKATESVVLSVYTFTGGAHGSTVYKAFTASRATGTLLPLTSFIKADQRDLFVAYVKKALIAWRPEGSTDTVVFPDDVNKLDFSSLQNWAIDQDNLVIYFDQYAVGPGSLGAVPFPIPLSKIKDMVVSTNPL